MPSKMNVIMQTEALPWVVLRKGITAVDLASGIKMTSALGGWDRRLSNNAVEIGVLPGIKHHMPGHLMIAPWVESGVVNSGVFFEVGGYRGANNNYDRIARVSGVFGSARLTLRADGTSCTAAAVSRCWYCDLLTVTDYTDGTVLTTDADGSGVAGKGYLSFDMRGLEYVCVNILNMPGQGRVGFEISGY